MGGVLSGLGLLSSLPTAILIAVAGVIIFLGFIATVIFIIINSAICTVSPDTSTASWQLRHIGGLISLVITLLTSLGVVGVAIFLGFMITKLFVYNFKPFRKMDNYVLRKEIRGGRVVVSKGFDWIVKLTATVINITMKVLALVFSGGTLESIALPASWFVSLTSALITKTHQAGVKLLDEPVKFMGAYRGADYRGTD